MPLFSRLIKGEVIAIEDSPNGALAAKRAGIRCVVVPNGMTKNLRFPDVDIVLESLKDFDMNMFKE
ncbi:hypothetical protein [Ammoniphilus sp. 3BR4]|uniref:hypothetical protein n=1 Tax=Ammoniphilus sp. 3BR4 TaxID=3158265 RepID=UPI003467C7C8